MDASKNFYTLAECSAMPDDEFSMEFIRLTNGHSVKCVCCRRRLIEFPLAFIGHMRHRVSLTNAKNGHKKQGGLDETTCPVKSCDDKRGYNNRANPRINPAYQELRKTTDINRAAELQEEISDAVFKAYHGEDPGPLQQEQSVPKKRRVVGLKKNTTLVIPSTNEFPDLLISTIDMDLLGLESHTIDAILNINSMTEYEIEARRRVFDLERERNVQLALKKLMATDLEVRMELRKNELAEVF
jgi:hypothetical protein